MGGSTSSGFRYLAALILCLTILRGSDPVLAQDVLTHTAFVGGVRWQDAALIAILYYLSQSAWVAGLGFWTLYRPLVGGALVGLILGDVGAGVRVGATINLAYLGFIAAGGNLPADISLAGYLGTAIALAGGLDAGAALALTVPVGIVGFLIYQLRMTLDVLFVHWADGYVATGNVRGLFWCNVLLPQGLLFLLSVPPCVLGAYYGPALLADLLAEMPAWLLPALSVVGNMLVAVGIATNLRLIWRGANGAYFVGVFILASSLSLTILGWTLLAVAAAIVHVRSQQGREDGKPDLLGRPVAAEPGEVQPASEMTGRAGETVLGRRTLLSVWLNWMFFSHACYNFERFQGLSFAQALVPALRELYPTRSEFVSAIRRQAHYYNSEPNVGTLAHGVVLALEDARSRGEQVSEEMILATKAGLMGPLSGLGDTLIQGTIAPLLLSLGVSLAMDGSLLGPILYVLLIAVVVWGISWRMLVVGYHQGRMRIAALLQRGSWQQVLLGAEIIGSVILAVLGTNYVRLEIPVLLRIGEMTLQVQEEILDKLLPQMLPLGLILGYTWLLGRRVTLRWLVFGTFLVGLGASLLGVLQQGT